MKALNRISKSFVALGLTFVTLIGTATAAEGLEARRVSQNASCIAKMSPVMRPKIRAVLTDMESAGFKPIIDLAVYRTPAEQLKLYRAGHSKVTYSYHNATSKSGKPDSLAADIVDQRFGWTGKAPRLYWFLLARSGLVHDLYSGSHFGLSTSQRTKFRAALVLRDLAYSGPIGWDPAHLEPRGLSLAKAKAGLRPYSN
jgi:hypothetical protein